MAVSTTTPTPPRNRTLWQRFKDFFGYATIQQQRAVALVLLVCQIGITITGSTVRVTGSGLGCETWPKCHPDSLVPVEGLPIVHQIIEFGNRLLTFVVSAAAIAAIVVVYKARRRKELKVYAWASFILVVVQAIIGGISVLLNLRWWAVALHFLPSMALVWLAAMLYSRIKTPDDGTPTRQFPGRIQNLTLIANIALIVVLITGTMVTGSGVHSGDAAIHMESRLQVNTEYMAVAHAMCMYVYLAFTLVVVWMLYRHGAPSATKKAGVVLIAIILLQWVIGVIQFRLGIPRWTVPAHVGMSGVVTCFSALLYAHGVTRVRKGDANELVTGSPAGDTSRAAHFAS